MIDSPRFELGEKISVSIEKLIFSGPGLARTDRGVVFVDFAAPGDRLEVEVTEVKKSYARARITQIIEASSERVPAPCLYYGNCGGCDWQHLNYPFQLQSKHQLLVELFTKELQFTKVEPVRSSSATFNYRNRIQVHFGPQGPSYRSKRSHDLVPIQNCLIADERINQKLLTLKASPGERVQISAEGDRELVSETEELSFDFSQVNTLQNQALKDEVLLWLEDCVYDRFLDLYAGAGNFSFLLAENRPSASGMAVESHPVSVQKAQAELRRRKWSSKRLNFLNSRVDAILGRLPTDASTLLFLDPPRAGCSPEVSRLLSDIECRQMIYLSCDPATLVRDLKQILGKGKFRLDRVVPFDMFPQTSHCEVLVSLSNVL